MRGEIQFISLLTLFPALVLSMGGNVVLSFPSTTCCPVFYCSAWIQGRLQWRETQEHQVNTVEDFRRFCQSVATIHFVSMVVENEAEVQNDSVAMQFPVVEAKIGTRKSLLVGGCFLTLLRQRHHHESLKRLCRRSEASCRAATSLFSGKRISP